jgi:ferredoxin
VSPAEAIRARARDLLASKQVALVVGYRAGSQGRAQPAFIERPEDADTLIFDRTCGPNLADYLPRVKHKGRIAVVAKGCDARSILVLVKEGQLDRAQLHIIGTGCEGILDDGELSDACATCAHPNPVVSDDLIGEPVPARAPAADPLADFEALTPDERWQQLAGDTARCIRCYACRQVCPNCYCPVCFVDANNPQWVGRTTDPTDNLLFHLMRAMHMAGRCVECGACARACPVGIDLMKFNRKVARIVRDRFAASAGVDPDAPPALAAFDQDDRQEFIK